MRRKYPGNTPIADDRENADDLDALLPRAVDFSYQLEQTEAQLRKSRATIRRADALIERCRRMTG